MKRVKNTRDTVLKYSRAYYAHRASYWDRLDDKKRDLPERYQRELKFLKHAFNANATRLVLEVLDVACGLSRHIIELAKQGYECTGWDYTPENIKIARERAKREGVSVKLLQGDVTQLSYENAFDAVIAFYILFLLPNDDDVLKCLRLIHRALRPGGILVCNIGNPFSKGKNWFSLEGISEGLKINEERTSGLHVTEIIRLIDFDPVYGVAWWQETSIVETPEGTHVFRDKERLRLFTYWDIIHYLQIAGFKTITCYPDWKTKSPKKPKGIQLVFVSRKE